MKLQRVAIDLAGAVGCNAQWRGSNTQCAVDIADGVVPGLKVPPLAALAVMTYGCLLLRP